MTMWHSQKAPKGAGELIVYLDFDGVLHHENCLWHPKRGPYLEAPLENVDEPYPASMRYPFSEKLLERLIG